MKFSVKNLVNIGFSLGLKAFAAALGMLVTIVIDKYAGVNYLGIFSQLQLIMSYAVLICLFGNDQFMFQNRERTHNLNSIFSRKIIFFLLTAVIVFLIVGLKYSWASGILFVFSMYLFLSNRITGFYALIIHGYNTSDLNHEIFTIAITIIGVLVYPIFKIDFVNYMLLILIASRSIGFIRLQIPNMQDIKSEFRNLKYFVISILNLASHSWELLLFSFVISSEEFAVISVNMKLVLASATIAVSLPLRKIQRGLVKGNVLNPYNLILEPILIQLFFLFVFFFVYSYFIGFWGSEYRLFGTTFYLVMVVSILYVLNATTSLLLLDKNMENYDIKIRLLRVIVSLLLITVVDGMLEYLILVSLVSLIEGILKIFYFVRNSNSKLQFRSSHA